MKADAGGRPPAGWPLLAVFTGLQALAFGNRFLLALLATPVSRAMGVDDLRMGVLQGTAFIVPFVLFTPVFGLLIDRFPRGWPVPAGLVLSTLAVAWSATADGFGALLGARMLLGVGEAAVAPAALVLIARAAPAGRAGLATALFAAGGPVGKGLALTAGGALLGLCTRLPGPLPPWREVLWIAAALNLLAVAATWRALASRRAEAKTAAVGPPAAARLGGAGAAVRLAGAAGAGVTAVLASQTAASWAPSLFVRSFSLTPARAGVVTGSPLLLITPACGLLMGWLLDRAGGRARGEAPVLPSLAVCLAAAGALALALRAATDASWAQVVFGALVGALGAGAVAGLRGVQQYAPDASRGRVAAGYVAAANLVGFGVGPPLVGWLSTAAGHGGAGRLAAALTTVVAGVSAAGVATAVAAALLSKRPSHARADLKPHGA